MRKEYHAVTENYSSDNHRNMTRYLGPDHYADQPKVKLTLKPVPKALMVVLTAGVLIWLGASTFVPQKKVVQGSAKIPAHLAIQIAYEDKLSAMQTALDQLHNRLADNTQAYATKLAKLRGQQALLAQRHQRLEKLFQRTLGSSGLPISALPPKGRTAQNTLMKQHDGSLRITKKMLDLRAQQNRLIASVANHTTNQAKKLSAILQNLKAKNTRKRRATATGTTHGTGGPFIRLSAFATLNQAIDKIDNNTFIINNLTKSLADIPIVHPVGHTAKITSRFGPRKDPMRKTRAMHSGIDFKGKKGTPVLAAANGIVIKAGRYKAYGRMVELKHKSGVTTRYAHLSRIGVNVGNRVMAHQLIGRIGSTGRSTGPHLHYETRLRGKAVNPLRFLQAGKHVYEVKSQSVSP